MRIIDADALIEVIENERTYLINRGLNGMEDAIVHHILPLIDNAPAIDAVPVVRCKECMYFKKWIIDFMGDTDDTIELHSCSYNNYGTNRDGYCNRGKRREP